LNVQPERYERQNTNGVRSAVAPGAGTIRLGNAGLWFGSKENDMNSTVLDPKLLGFWARCIRECWRV
jgi:hypothetical protein